MRAAVSCGTKDRFAAGVASAAEAAGRGWLSPNCAANSPPAAAATSVSASHFTNRPSGLCGEKRPAATARHGRPDHCKAEQHHRPGSRLGHGAGDRRHFGRRRRPAATTAGGRSAASRGRANAADDDARTKTAGTKAPRNAGQHGRWFDDAGRGRGKDRRERRRAARAGPARSPARVARAGEWTAWPAWRRAAWKRDDACSGSARRRHVLRGSGRRASPSAAARSARQEGKGLNRPRTMSRQAERRPRPPGT